MNKTFEITYSEPCSDAKDVLTLEARDEVHARLLTLYLFDGKVKIYGVKEKPQG